MAESPFPYKKFQGEVVEGDEPFENDALTINTNAVVEPPSTSINDGTLDESLISDYRIYLQRWYVLFLFAILGLTCNMISSAISTIAPIAEPALALTQTDISLLANWFNIMFLVSVFPYMWLVQVKGLRMPIVTGAICVAVGAFVRCLNTGGIYPTLDKVLLHLGHAINGTSASILWFACTKLSVVWFPPSERTISTSIGLLTGGLGTAVSFVVGPYTVTSLANKWAVDDKPTDENYAAAIRVLFYGECLASAVLCLVTLIYFPSSPPTPPSYSASSVRMDFLEGMKCFAKSFDAWIILSLYMGSGSVLAGWTQFLAIMVEGIMDDIQAGWLGCALTIAQFISGPIASATVEKWFHSRPKLICSSLLFIGATLTVVFLVAEVFVRSIYSAALCWATLVPAALFITAAQPLWWEMACEALYPVPEQIVAGIFSLGFTIASVIFFMIYSFPSIGTQWANWCLAAGQCVCVPIIFFYSGKKRRLAQDQEAEERRRTDLK